MHGCATKRVKQEKNPHKQHQFPNSRPTLTEEKELLVLSCRKGVWKGHGSLLLDCTKRKVGLYEGRRSQQGRTPYIVSHFLTSVPRISRFITPFLLFPLPIPSGRMNNSGRGSTLLSHCISDSESISTSLFGSFVNIFHGKKSSHNYSVMMHESVK